MTKKNPELANMYILEASTYEKLGDFEAMFDSIAKGFLYDPCNAELFFMLGNYFRSKNTSQSYLCYEMAIHYCEDENDAQIISEASEALFEHCAKEVRNLSVMILSYNDLEIMKECISTIESSMPEGSFEIVVVDNNSTDPEVARFLKEKEKNSGYGFKLILNEENAGFPKGCNIGAKACSPGNDILFINNDAVASDNSIFWLRMGLYESRDVGATSAMSNKASLQSFNADWLESAAWNAFEKSWIELEFNDQLQLFETVTRKYSVPSHNPYIPRFRLTGFAVLVSRPALDVVAPEQEVFDELYSPGYFEDDDLGIRLALAGFKQYLCSSSYIYHKGGSGFSGHNDAMERSREKFIAKWGFDPWKFSLPWGGLENAIKEKREQQGSPLRIIDLTISLGANVSRIKDELPDSYVAMVCGSEMAAKICRNIADDVAFCIGDDSKMPFPDHSFDVAIIDDERSKELAKRFLKQDGICLWDA